MARGLLIIRTLTPTHPGAGTSTGAIDLMLQREVTTNFPFVQGSSLKGAIRSHLRDEPQSVLNQVFGPRNSDGANLSKGTLTITDASLLFYPVRSLKGLYALVTCPEILRRLKMPHINLKIPETLLKLDDKSRVKALNATKSKYGINGKVYFEDLNFSITEINQNELDWIKKLGFNGDPQKDDSEFRKLADRLFIVHDDVFQYFVEFATQVMSRNRISYETGVVKTGALWTEEHLPPETYLFSYLEDDEKPVDGSQTAFKWLESKFNSSNVINVIHLGGDETVGKGFVELNVKSL